MKNIIFITLILLNIQSIYAQQKYLTKEGKVDFFSHTLVEDITAENTKTAGIIDSENGEVVITLAMTSFEFEKKLMEEHFNENYVESEKYPKATFKGFIVNNKEIDYSSPASYKVKVQGTMEIHGKKKNIEVDGTVEVGKDFIIARTKFKLNPEDYGIKIPKLVRKNIAEELQITAELKCMPIE